MLHDMIFTLPDGRDAIVRLDTTLDKNEIRVGSLGALDQFMLDAKELNKGKDRLVQHAKRAKTVRLSNAQIRQAQELIDKGTIKYSSKEEERVMQFFFPKGKERMVSSKEIEGNPSALGMGAERAREIRNRVLRRAKVIS